MGLEKLFVVSQDVAIVLRGYVLTKESHLMGTLIMGEKRHA